jgi:hypothetical protein
MSNPAESLRMVVDAASERLVAISEAATEVKREGEWCAKEVMGHLIDSAANNHARFVRAQFTDDLVFPGYDQEAWVRAQRAAGEPWFALVNLWRDYNRHLAYIIGRIPEEILHCPRARHSLDQIAWQTVPADQPATLDYLIRDYIGHLEEHVRQVYTMTGTGAT